MEELQNVIGLMASKEMLFKWKKKLIKTGDGKTIHGEGYNSCEQWWHFSFFSQVFFYHFANGLYLHFCSQTTMIKWAYYFNWHLITQYELNYFSHECCIFVCYQSSDILKIHMTLWIWALATTCTALVLISIATTKFLISHAETNKYLKS